MVESSQPHGQPPTPPRHSRQDRAAPPLKPRDNRPARAKMDRVGSKVPVTAAKAPQPRGMHLSAITADALSLPGPRSTSPPNTAKKLCRHLQQKGLPPPRAEVPAIAVTTWLRPADPPAATDGGGERWRRGRGPMVPPPPRIA
jgi:hypothetical protein